MGGDDCAGGRMSAGSFSLMTGGPWFRFCRRVGLCGENLEGVERRIAVAVAIIWLPLLLLSLLDGRAMAGAAVPFLRDVDLAARFLVALPLFLIAEVVLHHRFPKSIGRFVERGLVPVERRSDYDRIVASTQRWLDSTAVEAFLLGFVYVIGVGAIWRNVSAFELDTWYGTMEQGRLVPRLAGYWLIFVSVPLFQFVLWRWYFRILLWWRLLWQLSRLDLRLQPLHPDKAGGLGFLAQLSLAFAPLAMAQGAMASGWIAGQIFVEGAQLPDFKLELCAAALVVVFFVVGPLLVFMPQMSASKRAGLAAYGGLAMQYAQDFQDRWLQRREPATDSPLGSGDIQSLADLGNSYATLQQMRVVPFGTQTLSKLAIAMLAPVAPLVLTMMPMDVLLTRLLGFLL
jgi:hypothetical protein